MAGPKFLGFDSLALHAGYEPEPHHGSRAVPIYQTTSYVFEDGDHAASLFNLEQPGHIYSRISNPTVSAFEERVAAIEHGVAAVATASGQAALHLAVSTLLSAGDHIVACRNLYGGSINLLALTLPRFGIETTLVNPNDFDGLTAAIKPNTKLIFGETIGNPRLEVLDLPRVAEIAQNHQLPLMVDNTFASPYLLQPIDHGADIVMHSATKWIGGHGVAVGGVLVDGGKFDWHASGKFPTLTEPYPGYADMIFADEFGPSAFSMRARAEGLRDFGACMAPQTAFYLLQGLETLSLRVQRHVSNTKAVLDFLAGQEAVNYVLHPTLPDHVDFDIAQRLLPAGAGSIVTFGLAGGRAAGVKFINACELASHLANVGDARTLVIHPASTTHVQLSDEQLRAAGLGEDMIRISVGLEDPDDITNDLKRAISASQKT